MHFQKKHVLVCYYYYSNQPGPASVWSPRRLTAQNRCSLAPPLVKLVYVYLTFGCFRGSVPPRLKMILQLFLLCALYL